MKREMEIIVNGVKEKVPGGSSIYDLIGHFQEKDAHMIVEHNGRFVYPQEYDVTVVTEGDTIEFINPDFGG